jgi:hypothetical protein
MSRLELSPCLMHPAAPLCTHSRRLGWIAIDEAYADRQGQGSQVEGNRQEHGRLVSGDASD